MLFLRRPRLSNPVTPKAISIMLNNPEPDPSSPLDIVVQIFNINNTKKKELQFSINDGTMTLEAVFLGIPNQCPRIKTLKNFAFIRIIGYRVKNVTGKSKKYLVINKCEAVAPPQRSLVEHRPHVPLEECITPGAIDSMISKKPLPTINLQVLDVKAIEDNIILFTASDGRKQLRAMINFKLLPENSKTNTIANLSLITILNYSLEDVIPGESTKFLLIFNFKPLQSCITWEVKYRDFRNVVRFKLSGDDNGASSGVEYKAPPFDKADFEIYTSMKRVALVYDKLMLKHGHPTLKSYEEKPERVSAIWEQLVSHKFTDRCFVLDGEFAHEMDVLQVHSQKHVDWVTWLSSVCKTLSSKQKLKMKSSSVFCNDFTTEAAFLAAGSALKAAERVATGAFDASVAIVRPPGHHAEPDEAMGFCFFNNVAVAASYLLARSDLGIKRILIVDWDVHAGNGTQKMFYNSRKVLFFSVHRFDNANFYPGKKEGGSEFVGDGLGAGYNINVPWKHDACSDSDYIHVWDNLLLPVVKEFNPDIILISAGFDAAAGDIMGECQVTPNGYATLIKKLMKFAGGKVVLILEGGYDPGANAASVEACVEALLAEKPDEAFDLPPPRDAAVEVTLQVRRNLKYFWPFLVPEDELYDSDYDE